jgi:hypothetical protein
MQPDFGKVTNQCDCARLINRYLCSAKLMVDRDHKDSYSEAIPIDRLVKMAETDINACSVQSEQVIRQCADRVVREVLCPCVSSVDSIVDAVVDEYMNRLGSRKID